MDKNVFIIPWGISSKLNVIAQMEFKHTYFEAAIQNLNHYATRTLLSRIVSDHIFPCDNITGKGINPIIHTVYILLHEYLWH